MSKPTKRFQCLLNSLRSSPVLTYYKLLEIIRIIKKKKKKIKIKIKKKRKTVPRRKNRKSFTQMSYV